MKDTFLTLVSAIAIVAFLTLIVATLAWMTIPTTIVYYESSPVMTATQTINVVEHSQAHFITPEQKARLDFVRNNTGPIWIACVLILMVSMSVLAWSDT